MERTFLNQLVEYVRMNEDGKDKIPLSITNENDTAKSLKRILCQPDKIYCKL